MMLSLVQTAADTATADPPIDWGSKLPVPLTVAVFALLLTMWWDMGKAWWRRRSEAKNLREVLAAGLIRNRMALEKALSHAMENKLPSLRSHLAHFEQTVLARADLRLTRNGAREALVDTFFMLGHLNNVMDQLYLAQAIHGEIEDTEPFREIEEMGGKALVSIASNLEDLGATPADGDA